MYSAVGCLKAILPKLSLGMLRRSLSLNERIRESTFPGGAIKKMKGASASVGTPLRDS